MKKRNRVLAGLLCAAMALTVGCGKTETIKEETKAEEAEIKEEDQYLSWLEEAFQQYNEEKIRGTITEITDSMEDGSTDVTKIITTMDTEKQQIMQKCEYSNPEWMGSTEYYTKEGDKEYRYMEGYTWDDAGVSSSIPLKVLLTGDKFSYGYSEQVIEANSYKSDEDREISDVKVSKEGETDLDGTAALKLKVEYKQRFKLEEATRESILEGHEMTEEDVAMLDGFSEQVDAYVDQQKRYEEENASPEEIVDIVYITSSSHELLRIEYAQADNDNNEEEINVTNRFYDGINKISYAKDRMAEGLSREEAIRMANEAIGDSTATDSMPRVVSSVSTTNFVVGDQCEAIGELPADAREITDEQYLNGEY